jgi:hypothetical protein
MFLLMSQQFNLLRLEVCSTKAEEKFEYTKVGNQKNYSDSVYFLFVFYFISKGRVYEVGMTSRKITTRDWYFKHILLFIKTKG